MLCLSARTSLLTDRASARGSPQTKAEIRMKCCAIDTGNTSFSNMVEKWWRLNSYPQPSHSRRLQKHVRTTCSAVGEHSACRQWRCTCIRFLKKTFSRVTAIFGMSWNKLVVKWTTIYQCYAAGRRGKNTILQVAPVFAYGANIVSVAAIYNDASGDVTAHSSPQAIRLFLVNHTSLLSSALVLSGKIFLGKEPMG